MKKLTCLEVLEVYTPPQVKVFMIPKGVSLLDSLSFQGDVVDPEIDPNEIETVPQPYWPE